MTPSARERHGEDAFQADACRTFRWMIRVGTSTTGGMPIVGPRGLPTRERLAVLGCPAGHEVSPGQSSACCSVRVLAEGMAWQTSAVVEGR